MNERDAFLHVFRNRHYSDVIDDLVFLGIYNYFKWDRIFLWEQQNPGKNIDAQTYWGISNGFSDREIDEYRRRASVALSEKINSNSNRWSRGFWQSFWATAAYSLVLFAVFLVAKYLGSDIAAALGMR